MTLDEAVAKWKADHPECEVGDEVYDQCITYSEAFAHFVGSHGVDAEMISGFTMEGNVILQGHSATLVYGAVVFDWTARQFDPAAEVPLVMPLAEWRQTWRNLND